MAPDPPDRQARLQQGTLLTLANGLAVVETLARGPLGLTELSEAVNLPKQTTYRLVRTLILRDWVARYSDDTYRLTTKLWSVAALSFDLREVRDTLSPMIRQLANETGETVHLATLEGAHVVYIDKVDGWHPIRSYTELGGTAPAHCVATGKLLLSLLGTEELHQLYRQEPERFTERTLGTLRALEHELKDVASEGYAVNRGEWRPDVGGVAVLAVEPPASSPIALGFSGPVERILERQDELVQRLRQAVMETPYHAASLKSL